jgi:hypothetical protein
MILRFITALLVVFIVSSAIASEKTCFFAIADREPTAHDIAEYQKALANGVQVPFMNKIICTTSYIANKLEIGQKIPAMSVGLGNNGTSKRKIAIFQVKNATYTVGSKLSAEDLAKYSDIVSIDFDAMDESSFTVAPDIDKFKAIKALNMPYNLTVLSSTPETVLNIEARRNGFDFTDQLEAQPANRNIANELNQYWKSEEIQLQGGQLYFLKDKKTDIKVMILGKAINLEGLPNHTKGK